jgi:hypothetical protein
MSYTLKKVLRTVPIVVAALAITGTNAEEKTGPVKAVQVIGFPGVKDNAKGTLKVENGTLHFVHDKETSDISSNAIQDVVTGTDSQKAVGKTLGTLSMAAPYGGGRVVSLFRKKIDTLTVQYRDSEGALHGIIFTLRSGSAEGVKKELVAQGAHTTAPDQAGSAQSAPKSSEEKQ